MDSHIILFLKGKCPDYKGRTLIQLRCMSHYKLEKSHDVIQWMFPTDIPSEHCLNAPVLTDEDIETIKKDKVIQANIKLSLDRMVRFYEKNDVWITIQNHNFLRITRILRCLWLAGLTHEYVCVQKVLDDIYHDYAYIIGEDTLFYWKAANDKEFLENPDKYLQHSFTPRTEETENEHRNSYDDGDDQGNLFFGAS